MRVLPATLKHWHRILSCHTLPVVLHFLHLLFFFLLTLFHVIASVLIFFNSEISNLFYKLIFITWFYQGDVFKLFFIDGKYILIYSINLRCDLKILKKSQQPNYCIIQIFHFPWNDKYFLPSSFIGCNVSICKHVCFTKRIRAVHAGLSMYNNSQEKSTSIFCYIAICNNTTTGYCW